MPLASAKNGQTVRVLTIQAGRGLQARLAAMGIAPGAEITVIASQEHGPFVVAVKGSRVVLGRGMTSRIDVI